MENKLLYNLAHQYFQYKDGNLYWKIKKSNTTNIGDKVGCIDTKGYCVHKINRKIYKVHRTIFLMHYGYLPKYIDHIDGNPQNNCIENLRETNFSKNAFNRNKPRTNTSGVKNIFWRPKDKKWQVGLVLKGKFKSFGVYADIELAELVAIEARNKYHGEFANHG